MGFWLGFFTWATLHGSETRCWPLTLHSFVDSCCNIVSSLRISLYLAYWTTARFNLSVNGWMAIENSAWKHTSLCICKGWGKKSHGQQFVQSKSMWWEKFKNNCWWCCLAFKFAWDAWEMTWEENLLNSSKIVQVMMFYWVLENREKNLNKIL